MFGGFTSIIWTNPLLMPPTDGSEPLSCWPSTSWGSCIFRGFILSLMVWESIYWISWSGFCPRWLILSWKSRMGQCCRQKGPTSSSRSSDGSQSSSSGNWIFSCSFWPIYWIPFSCARVELFTRMSSLFDACSNLKFLCMLEAFCNCYSGLFVSCNS